GQRIRSSNPFGLSESAVYTTLNYDALGRVTQVNPPSGLPTQYQYSGNAVTLTDPAGKQRKNFTDALGRLIEVDEPNSSDQGTKATASVTISGGLNMAASLTGVSAPNAAANSKLLGYFDSNGMFHLVYEAAQQHRYEMYGNGSVVSGYWDLTFEAGSRLAASGSALTFFFDSYNTPHWAYIGSDQRVYLIYTNGTGWHYVEL